MKSEQQDRLNIYIDYALVSFISIFAFVLIFTNNHPSNNVVFLKSLFVDVSSEIQSQITNVDDYFELKQQNDSLRIELENVYRNNLKYKNAHFELIDLKKNLNFKFSENDELIYSEIIAEQSTSLTKQLTINRGFSDSIKLNDVVLYKNSLVGKICFVTEHYSRVQLAIDPLFEVSVRIQRTGQIATLTPNTDGYFNLNYITKIADALPGDVVVTSGLSSTYPKNIKLGVIQSVSTDVAGLFYEIKVFSDIDFNVLRYVSVIHKKERTKLDSLTEMGAYEAKNAL